jgi:hypothetical protein
MVEMFLSVNLIIPRMLSNKDKRSFKKQLKQWFSTCLDYIITRQVSYKRQELLTLH